MGHYSVHGLLYWFCKHSGVSVLENKGQAERNRDKKLRKAERHIEKGNRSRRLRVARRGQRRNLRPRQPRKKDWAVSPIEWDDSDHELRERIMPIDESDRRRALEKAVLGATGGKLSLHSRSPIAVGEIGTVVSVSRGLCVVEINGAQFQCRIRGKLTVAETSFTSAVAVGDEVEVSRDGSGDGIVEEVMPRTSLLTRPEVSHGNLRQVIAANVDQVLIVSSWREPRFWPELVDRCIIASQRSDITPVVCINKIDLAVDSMEVRNVLQPYERLGHHVITTSAITGEGIDTLRDVLRDKKTALTGMSGTGKSSLISATQPGLNLRISHVSKSGEGRHTTTQATMFGLGFGGFVVDTPGIREFGLSGLRRHELAAFYPEIASLALMCRFSNCSHVEEPDCAVAEGVANSSVHLTRYHSFRAIHGALSE